MGNSGKSNGKFGKKQWKFGQKQQWLPEIYAAEVPSFLIAFAQIFPLLLPEYSIGFARFPIAFSRNSGKSNWELGQKQWTNLGKSNEKLGNRWDIFRAKIWKFGVTSRVYILFSKFTS